MPLPTLGSLLSLTATDRLDLLAAPVAAALSAWSHRDEVGGRRDGAERIAACLVRADTRADVNGAARRALDVRTCSFLPTERAVAESGMEHGGITPVGLPDGWRLLVAAQVLEVEVLVLGSGLRRSKLLLPGRLVAELPHAEVVDGLAD